MATDAQIASNRSNSLLSTGPKTAEGKDASRRNACRHGLAGAGGVVSEGARAEVEARAAMFRAEFRPATEYERGLVEQMAVDSVRLGRCRDAFLVLCEGHANRAALCWDEDRRAEAEEVAARLGWDPSRSRSRLEQDRHGCEALIGRWEGLGRTLREVGGWDDSQRSMALDFLGVPVELRGGTTAVDPPEGGPIEAASLRLALVEGELARLRRRKAEAFDRIDAQDREAAEAGIGAELSRPLKLLQRYEAACWRRQQAAARALGERPRPPGPVATRTPPSPSPTPRREPAPRPPRPRLDDLDESSTFKRAPKLLATMTLDELFDFYELTDDEPTPAGPPARKLAASPDRRT